MSVTSLRKHKKLAGDVPSATTLTREGKKIAPFQEIPAAVMVTVVCGAARCLSDSQLTTKCSDDATNWGLSAN